MALISTHVITHYTKYCMGKKHVLTKPGRYEEIKSLCEFVCKGADEAGFDETAVFHIELACDEACTNIIEHAYGEENAGNITISYQTDQADFVITIQDNGRPFELKDNLTPPPQLSEDLSPNEVVENLKVGGLGLHFIHELMDDVRFTSGKKKGNILTMVKKLPKEGQK